MPVINRFLAVAFVCGLAVQPVFAQGSGRRASSAQQALENRLRRFENLPNSPNARNTGIPGLDNSGQPGARANRGRIPQTIRERRDAVRSRRFTNRDEHQALRERIERPGRGLPGQAMPAQGEASKKAAERPGVRQSQFVSHGRNRRAYTQADRLLAQRLAQIDRLRDQYLETGDSRLLEQADRLERQARERYEFRLDGREPPSEISPPLHPAPRNLPRDDNATELPTPAGPEMP